MSDLIAMGDVVLGCVLVVVAVIALYAGVAWVSGWLGTHPRVAIVLQFVICLCMAIPLALLLGIGLGHVLWLGTSAVWQWFGA